MLFPLLLGSTLALGSAPDPRPGLVLPGADPLGEPSGSAGAGVVCDTGAGCGPLLEASFAPTRRLLVIGQVPVRLDDGLMAGGGSLAGRFLVVDLPGLRLGPFLSVSDLDAWGPESAWQAWQGTLGGLTARAGIPMVNVDLALPLLRFTDGSLDPLADAVLGSTEIGASAGLAGHRVRGGISALAPHLAYRFVLPFLYAEAGVLFPSLDGERNLLARLHAGARF